MSRKQWVLASVALAAVLAVSPAARADPPPPSHTEVREFVIQVGKSTAGHYHLTISRQADGTESISASANVEVRSLIGKYTYSIQSTEVWKDYKLQSLSASGSDDGKRFEVSATAESNGLRVRANGQERVTHADVWTTSYWKLAEARFHNQAIPLLDCDTGKDIGGRLTYLGIEQMNVAGQAQKCYHFRVTGPAAPVDVWYDAQHRLVRQEFTESGQHTIFHLTTIKR
jgi:hypothetical protein